MTALTFVSCSALVILPILLESREWTCENMHLNVSCFAFVHLQALHLVHLNADAMKLKQKQTDIVYFSFLRSNKT